MDRLEERLAALEQAVGALQAQKATLARRAQLWKRAAVGLGALSLVALSMGPVRSGAPPAKGTGDTESRIAAIESNVTTLQSQVSSIQTQVIAVQAEPAALLTAPQVEDLQTQAAHTTALLAVADLSAYLQLNTLDATLTGGLPEVTVVGANLRVVNGMGSTATRNGLGNVIVGYNELRNSGNDRSGSHTIVVGTQNNYSGSGGLVAGETNSISERYSTVSGGAFNQANTDNASISGGIENIAGGVYSAVSGGAGNEARANYAWIGGGVGNLASGVESAVSGGSHNTASGDQAAVSGGAGNTAKGQYSSVSGGGSIDSSFNPTGLTETIMSGWAAGGLTGAGTLHVP